ncbi:MAG: CRISPR-associated endonuclease Cas6 [Methanoregula sp.]
MILDILTLTLDPVAPFGGTVQETNRYFSGRFSEYAKEHGNDRSNFLTRYPAVIVREIKGCIQVTGINEGAGFLDAYVRQDRESFPGQEILRISWDSPKISTKMEFGPVEEMLDYEFVTPWAGLTQENYRKFYTLKGKTERDAFVAKILADSLHTLAHALGMDEPGPVTCTTNLHFQKPRINGKSTIVFTGKFQMNFRIPDFLALGKSVGRGYGAIIFTGSSP